MLLAYLNKVIDNLKEYTSNTENIYNDKNDSSECALNGDDVVDVTAHIFFTEDQTSWQIL